MSCGAIACSRVMGVRDLRMTICGRGGVGAAGGPVLRVTDQVAQRGANARGPTDVGVSRSRAAAAYNTPG
jgi:hypothetical protein